MIPDKKVIKSHSIFSKSNLYFHLVTDTDAMCMLLQLTEMIKFKVIFSVCVWFFSA